MTRFISLAPFVAVAVCLAVGLVTAAALAPPAMGQENVPTIGILVTRPKIPAFDELPRRLAQLGHVAGGTVRLEYRYAEGRTERLARLAAELVRLDVAVIVAIDTPAVRAAKEATTTIPIVMAAGEPVGTGLIDSLARPGGNITGVSGTSAQITGKALSLFRELLPRATRLGLVIHRTDPFTRPFREQTHAAARRLGLEVHEEIVDGPKEVPAALASAIRARVDGVYVQGILATRELAARALRARLPALSHSGQFAGLGGLMGYGADPLELYGGLAVYVDKILKGAKPGDMPVQEPRNFILSVNLNTARAIGLTIPPSVLLQVDDAIE
ncbi:MAG: ABC transporter substrate-binding protein [Candidatus Rokuibacteriota bacterium]